MFVFGQSYQTTLDVACNKNLLLYYSGPHPLECSQLHYL